MSVFWDTLFDSIIVQISSSKSVLHTYSYENIYNHIKQLKMRVESAKISHGSFLKRGIRYG